MRTRKTEDTMQARDDRVVTACCDCAHRLRPRRDRSATSASAAEQAKRAKKVEEKVKADVDAMQKQAAEARTAAEAAATGDGSQ